jgi:hypothetical protein
MDHPRLVELNTFLHRLLTFFVETTWTINGIIRCVRLGLPDPQLVHHTGWLY